MKSIVVLFASASIGTIGLAIAATVQKIQELPQAMDTIIIIAMAATGIMFGLVALILARQKKIKFQ